jgi:diguanylate cyclase (GGDEF)-like protein
LDATSSTRWETLASSTRAFVATLGLLSVGCGAGLAITNGWRTATHHEIAVFIVLAAAAALAGHPGAAIGSDQANAGTFASIDSPVLMASALLLSPPLAVFVGIIGQCLSVRRPVTVMRVVGNCGKDALSTSAAAISWQVAGGPGLLSAGTHPNRQAVLSILALLTFNIVYLIVTATWVRLTTKAELRRIGLLHPGAIMEDLAQTSLGAVAALTAVHQPALLLVLLPMTWLVHRALVTHSIEREAELDAKTGAYNAAAWRREADRAITHAARLPRTVSIGMFDLDYFRDINSRYGHLGGDIVLTELAQRMRDVVRRYDVIGRFGGEEFAVLMPDATRVQAQLVAERIRSCIADKPVTLASGECVQVTISGGVATSEGSSSIEDLLYQADAALYAAKTAGRNRVQCAGIAP